jgi:hypothetical protein
MTKNIKTPAGTYGYAVEPWSKGEIYAVAADWAQASSPVYTYGPDGWDSDRAGRQVADFRHRPLAALRDEICYAIATSEGIPLDQVDDDEVEFIMAGAVEIDDSDDDQHDETKIVKVEIKHRTSNPYSRWVTPVGWKPVNPGEETDWVIEDGSLWSGQEEEAGMALLGIADLPEGDVVDVPLSELVWLESGTCKILCSVVIE